MRKAVAPILIAILSVGLASPVWAETLVEALALAYQTNPDLEARRAALRAADEGVIRATTGFLPSLTGNGNFTKQNRVTTQSSDLFGSTRSDTTAFNKFYEARLDQSLFRGLQTVNDRKRAKSLVFAARAQLASAEQTVLLDAVTAFMDVVRDEAVLRLRDNNVEVLTRQLEATRDRFRVGEITRTDVAQAEARLAGAVSARIAAAADLAASRARYRQVIGQQPGTLENPKVPELPANLDDALERAVGANPEIAIAQYTEEAAGYEVDKATGALLPTVDAFATINRFTGQAAFGAVTVNIASTTKAVGLQLKVPFYQGGAEYADIRRAKQLRSQRRLEVASARRRIRSQVRTAWERYRAALSSIESTSTQVHANEVALEGVRQEASVGSRTTLDVLDAEQELLDSRVQLVRATRDEVVAAYSLLSAVGALTVKDLNLPVEEYDPERYYRQVRHKLFGWGTGGD